MDLRAMRYGIVGAVVALPLGLVTGGFMAEVDWWLALMGTKWVAYKSAVSSVLMIGFGLGVSCCPRGKNDDTDVGKEDSSF